MISLFRIAAFVVVMAASFAMIWFGLSYLGVAEGSIAACNIVFGVIFVILAINFAPNLFSGHYVEQIPEKQRKQVKHRKLKILGDIVSVLVLAGYSYLTIAFVIDLLGAW